MVSKDRMSRIHRLEDTLEYAFKTLKELYIPRIGNIVLPVGNTDESKIAIGFASRLANRFNSNVRVVAFRKLLGEKTEERLAEHINKLRERKVKNIQKFVFEEFNSEDIANLMKGIPVEGGAVKKIRSFDLFVLPIPLTTSVRPYSSPEEKVYVYVEIVTDIVRTHATPVLFVKKTPLDESRIFGCVMVVIYDIDEMYSAIPIVLAVSDPKAEIMLSYCMDQTFLKSMEETMHELSDEASEVKLRIEELVEDKVERRIEEIEPKIALKKFRPFHIFACGETISTLQTLADENHMGLIVLTGYGITRLMEPEIANLILEVNRPILLIPSSLLREETQFQENT